MTSLVNGRFLVAGNATGPLEILSEPVSFWGGVDHHGVIIDVHHSSHLTSLTGKVLVLPSGRGSSSGSSVLAELIRTDSAPAAIVMKSADLIITLGALIANLLYAKCVPVLELSEVDYERLCQAGSGTSAQIGQNGISWE
jgi:predicted aconitase with swiveling domain